jgi:hypothetical protein
MYLPLMKKNVKNLIKEATSGDSKEIFDKFLAKEDIIISI